jgi:diguanylate cyclase (GGDEF)-like protein
MILAATSEVGMLTIPRPTRRVIAPILVVILCFCALCGYLLLEARRATYERAADVAKGLVTAIQADISRNIETVNLSLQGVADGLALPEFDRFDPMVRNMILFDRSAAARHLGRIAVLDENGKLWLDSQVLNPAPLDLSDRDYFQVHKNSSTAGLYISHPVFSRISGDERSSNRIVGVSRRISHADGTFAGVVVASLKLSYFEEIFRKITLGPDGSITLARSDGVALMRWPNSQDYIGVNLGRAQLFEELAGNREGRFDAVSVSDGRRRLFVYSQIGDLPLVIGVGQSTAEIYGHWRSYASTVGLLIVLLCATSAGLAFYLAREMGRRNAAEATLAVLATTDGLTGLSNRRSLKATFDREWRRAIRDQTPIALVMCDADLFKSYNDRHGHQAGDKLLQAIGIAMNRSIRRASDVAARYGGDEFFILLPATDADGGARLAEQVRRRLGTVCDEMDIAPAHLSIGVASMLPTLGDDQDALMSAADQALYRAKELGRDRIEVAQHQPKKPALIVNNAAA